MSPYDALTTDVPASTRVLFEQKTTNAHLQAFCRSPLTDSNRRPLLTMEDSSCGYAMRETRLVARFPCKLAGFSARCILPLKAPEPPRKTSNLSPEPSPKGACTQGHVGDR
jgi:hypothetical protein